ncbi:hypothetical protein V3H18_05630 [Methylocystis sp. 9N]|uniref:Uncharacterized protein n=1 Tax=Methylocystis borbori TaxID=3118750 RepID=A0ABU7XG64_9HYPH
MSLARTQALLARIYTDASLRRAFFDAPLAIAARFGLDGKAAETLALIDRREVETFAQSLLGKRSLDARKALPLTARLLEERFDALLKEAIEGPAAPLRRRADAAALSQRLHTLCAQGAIKPAWIADLARFELVFVQAAHPGATLMFRRFRYDIAPLAASVARGGPAEARPRTTYGIWARAPKGRLRWRLF